MWWRPSRKSDGCRLSEIVVPRGSVHGARQREMHSSHANPEESNIVDGNDLPTEAAELIQRQCDIDRGGAGPRAPVSGFTNRGVLIESRFAVLAELDTMRPTVGAMPELMVRRLEAIWCDSNAGACYTVTGRPGLRVPELRRVNADTVMEAGGGHNGIMFEADGGNGCHVDPDWGEHF